MIQKLDILPVEYVKKLNKFIKPIFVNSYKQNLAAGVSREDESPLMAIYYTLNQL